MTTAEADRPLVAIPPPVAVSMEQGAALLGVAPNTLEEFARSGQLRTFRMGRRRLVRVEALKEFARQAEEREPHDA